MNNDRPIPLWPTELGERGTSEDFGIMGRPKFEPLYGEVPRIEYEEDVEDDPTLVMVADVVVGE